MDMFHNMSYANQTNADIPVPGLWKGTPLGARWE
jgi:hypothetical protein